MQWSTTKKDLDMPTIQEELPNVLKRHWLSVLHLSLSPLYPCSY